MAIVDALSRALANHKTGFDFGSLTDNRAAISAAAIPTTSSSKTFTLSVSKNALDKAVAGAKSILDSLTAIRDKISASDGLTTTAVRGGESRVGLQTSINRLTGKIDDAVETAGDDDINLIGTPSTTYQLRTSSLGGSISVVSQPLDSQSLGLSDIDVTTQAGTDSAKTAIDDALRTATERYRLLSEAAADLPAPTSVTNSLVTSLKSLVGGGLLTGATGADSRLSAASTSADIGRGAVVNLRA